LIDEVKIRRESGSSRVRAVAGTLSSVWCELLHGRIAPAEKQQIMERFRRGETNALISTTVLEVGVDVPNAT